jgi:tetratricopeptide (TPR) repeat protein
MNLISRLNTLESSGLIRLLRAQPELEYLFRHALAQDAAYSSLLKQDRKRLHLAVGEALEHLYPEQRDELAATLAYHFERAEVHEKGIHYFTLAGDRARDGYANAEAVDFYRAAISQIEHALGKATEQPEGGRQKLARLFESLADVLELTGQHEAAIDAYQQALTELTQLGRPDRIEQARIHRKIGFVLMVNRRFAEAQQAWDQAENALGQPPSEQVPSEQTNAWRREWIEIQVERIWNHYWQFDSDGVERVCEKVFPVMERYGVPVQRARVLLGLNMMQILRERLAPSDEMIAVGQEALTAALASGNLGVIFDTHFQLGFMRLWRREFGPAEEHLQHAMRLAERTGDAIRESRCVTYLMLLARMRRQVDETRSYIPRVLDMAWAGQMTNYTATAKGCLAWIAWREGNLAEAREQGRGALELWQGPLANYPVKWPALWPLLAVALTEQNISEAIEYAQALAHPTHARFPGTLTAAIEAAIAASEQNQIEEARAQLNHAMNLAQEMGYL